MVDEIIEEIKKCDHILDKLLVITFYKRLYDDMVKSNLDDIECIIYLYDISFLLTLRNANRYYKNGIDTITFMNLFINIFAETLLKNDIVYLDDYLIDFRDSVEDMIDGCAHVAVISGYNNLSLETQIDATTIFSDYIINFYQKISNFTFNDESTSKKIMGELINPLVMHLNSYLNSCKVRNVSEEDLLNNLETFMSKKMEKVLEEKVSDGTISLNRLEDELSQKIVMNYSQIEKQVWTSYYIHIIAGTIKVGEAIPKDILDEICKTVKLNPLNVIMVLASFEEKTKRLIREIDSL